jgi:DNA repair protein RadD
MPLAVELRPEYQVQNLREIYAKTKVSRSVLYVLPTGGGKTVVAGRYCEQQIRAGKSGLVIVHTREQMEQAIVALMRFGLDQERDLGVIWRHDRRLNPSAPMQVATIDTLRRRTKPAADFVIVDEADLCLVPKWEAVLGGWYRESKIIGLTATPIRLDGKPMNLMFEDMVLGPTAAELCDMKGADGSPYLMAPRCFVPVRTRTVDTRGVRIKGRDWDQEDLQKRSCKRWVLAGITKHLRELGGDRNGFVFGCGAKHVNKLVAAINRDGRFRARALKASTPEKERRELLRPRGWLDSGKRRLVVTCEVASRGYDLPSAKLCVLARATCSEAIYRHQVGRILRPTKRNHDTPLILDHTRNTLRFGRPQDPRAAPWSLAAEPVKRGLALTDPPAKSKSCHLCGAVATLGSTTCAQCGGEFPTREPLEREGDLRELLPCAICGRASTPRSSSCTSNGQQRNAYCSEHHGRKRDLLPCCMCGNPAERHSSRFVAIGHQKRAFCENCKTPRPPAVPPFPCCVCGAASTRRSTYAARSRGHKPYCSQHKYGRRSPNEAG